MGRDTICLFWGYGDRGMISIILFCIYDNLDTQWLDDVFDVEKVMLSEIFDVEGKAGIDIRRLNEYIGWDYLVVPILREDKKELDSLLDLLHVPIKRRIYVIDGDLIYDESLQVDKFLNPIYLFQHQYRRGIKKLIASGEERQSLFWVFIGTDYLNIKVAFGEFGEIDGTAAYYLDPLSNAPILKLEEMVKYLHEIINECVIPCFVIYARVYDAYPYVDRVLRAHFPLGKLFLYYGDLIEHHGIKPDEAKKIGFDEVFSFDRAQADKYGIRYLRRPFSSFINKHRNTSSQYKVAFVGANKGRLKTILDVYECLSKAGISTSFYVTEVEESDKKYVDKIKYNIRLEYDELIEIESKADIILEIMQEEAFSPTTRYDEAVFLNKKLLTNCPELKNCKDRNIIYFENPTDIDVNRLCEPFYKNASINLYTFSVEAMIDSIKNTLKT